ncbi:MAG: ferrous iron transport protein B [Deltaproteobacteria bacterium]|nr:ferrous iron transport protein B [Deltaproteobacteria bacterium]
MADHCEDDTPRGASEAPPERRVALIGNPNTGKTTLFNQLTASRARVGNYPGVTVERRIGRMRLPGGAGAVALLDLPGTYSLTARSPEEQLAIEEVLGLGREAPALVVVVVDAGQLVRNLYLVLQLIELEVPLVVALNMIDEVETPPDHDALAKQLGVPVVPIAAKSNRGLDDLRSAVARGLESPPLGAVAPTYPAEVLADADEVAAHLPEGWRRGTQTRDRALALWALGSVDEHDELRGITAELRRACLDAQARPGRDHDAAIITARYRLLDVELAATAGVRDAEGRPAVRRMSERIDRVLLHPIFGFVVFVTLMLTVFQSLFSWSNPAIEAIEAAVAWLGGALTSRLPPGIVTDLLIEGVLGGVGNVVVFLPQILLLFLFLGLLEDSGYMARAAYLMDRVMRALGLHGRAFVPMLSGCACAIPAVLATRTMERERDRLLTMLVIPLMTCSARLPVYTLVIAALFPPSKVFGFVPVQALLMVAMYLFSTFTALAAAGVLGRTVVKGRRVPLLIELPPYRMPALRNVVREMLERSASFLKEAGTMILACTIVLWALLSFPRDGKPAAGNAEPPAIAQADGAPRANATPAEGANAAEPKPVTEAEGADPRAERLQQSYGARLGKALEPAIRPLGFDWKIGVGLIGAFAAREVFVSTMGLVYGIGDANEGSEPLRAKMRAESNGGKPAYSPLVGLSLMVFFALACQCMSTLAVVKRETRSLRWPAFLFAYMTALAYGMSFLVFQVGSALGF